MCSFNLWQTDITKYGNTPFLVDVPIQNAGPFQFAILTHIYNYGKSPFIVDLPIVNGDFPYHQQATPPRNTPRSSHPSLLGRKVTGQGAQAFMALATEDGMMSH